MRGDLHLLKDGVEGVDYLTHEQHGIRYVFAPWSLETGYHSDPKIRAFQQIYKPGSAFGKARKARRPVRASQFVAELAQTTEFRRLIETAARRGLSIEEATKENREWTKLLLDVEREERKLQLEEDKAEKALDEMSDEEMEREFFGDIVDAEVIDEEPPRLGNHAGEVA
jgi:hypothetical protein